MGIGGFAAMKALSTRNDEPERASRPFDAQRDGFVVGEGSGILILETLERAQEARRENFGRNYGLRNVGRCVSHYAASRRWRWRVSCDAQSVERREDRAAKQVSYVNSHGTSDPDLATRLKRRR